MGIFLRYFKAVLLSKSLPISKMLFLVTYFRHICGSPSPKMGDA